MDTPNMKKETRISTMILVSLFVIATIFGVLVYQNPTLLCWYIRATQAYSDMLPIHTREYQAFCEVHNHHPQQALSLLQSIKKEWLTMKDMQRIDHNIALLSEQTPEAKQNTTVENHPNSEKNIEWEKDKKKEWSPYAAENNTITSESKVQYQKIDNDWIEQEKIKLLSQQLDRDRFLVTQD